MTTKNSAAVPLRVMLVDDDAAFRTALADSFQIAGFEIETYHDGQSALANLAADYPGIVVTDIRMPKVDGHEVLEKLLTRDPDLPVILMTGHGDINMAVTALKKGAFDFIAKPFVTDHMIGSVRRALEMRRLVIENQRLRKAAAEAEQDFPLLGETQVMVRLRETIRQLASVDVDVLIEGETGTGKELVARMLHRWSARHTHSFIAIDCAALPDAVADDVLFGNRIQRGRIADSDRGTLFLDEIDSMSSSLQGKLLRVVEERELPGISGEPRAVNMRVVAAAKVNLGEAVKHGQFRSDLFYRLETVRLRIPPLRERRKDIGILFSYFLDEAAAQFRQPRPRIDATTEHRLNSDDWSGNVRELRNYAKQVVLGLKNDTSKETSTLPLSKQMDIFEEKVLREALERTNGDVGYAANILAMPRRSLYAKLQKFYIDAASFRKRSRRI
ncbi:sigma-54 dependent transcriptional regulator [Ochrobactrum sp. Marseille-Q0166]|uniref:sigma-54-dependent transcriptional regulator n=1 Tax=Ochrobactrum sp. Marseille-Q0166 TaxID=2761105 RepID=UPI0016557F90|nr:sigma-54 dependent transcriptional regulator [Ochrobactrum sp. Marseille-Q0166]MBC8718275.1 sigma-54-dependent Fis family transcriptional regulator [Ochrobactrum sp. Marseille-Q0166]